MVIFSFEVLFQFAVLLVSCRRIILLQEESGLESTEQFKRQSPGHHICVQHLDSRIKTFCRILLNFAWINETFKSTKFTFGNCPGLSTRQLCISPKSPSAIQGVQRKQGEGGEELSKKTRQQSHYFKQIYCSQLVTPQMWPNSIGRPALLVGFF